MFEGIDAGQQVEIGTFIGHRFTFRHFQNQQILDQVTILKGMTHKSIGKSELLELGIPNVMHIPGGKALPQQVKLWNFYDFDLAKYWLKGNEEMYSGVVLSDRFFEMTFVLRVLKQIQFLKLLPMYQNLGGHNILQRRLHPKGFYHEG